jgi:hypothetical protein
MKNHLETKITEQYGQIINKFRLLNHEWEADGYGYVVIKENVNKIIVTNHTRPLEVGVDYLRYKINEYEDAIKETKDIIKIVEDGKYKI